MKHIPAWVKHILGRVKHILGRVKHILRTVKHIQDPVKHIYETVFDAKCRDSVSSKAGRRASIIIYKTDSMPSHKKSPRKKPTGPFTNEEKSLILKVWLELVDEHKIITGPAAPLKKNKATLLNQLRLKCPEVGPRLLKDPGYKTPMYDFFRNFVWRHSRGKLDESVDASLDESAISEDAPSQSQGGPSSPVPKFSTSPNCSNIQANSQYHVYDKEDEKLLFEDPDSEMSDDLHIGVSKISLPNDQVPNGNHETSQLGSSLVEVRDKLNSTKHSSP